MVATQPHVHDDDLFAEAEKAEPISSDVYFGLVAFELWACVLVKGQGKVVFDPQQHSRDQRRIAYNLSLTPLARTGLQQWSIDRNGICESRDWGITKRSLQKLGVDLRTLHDKYAKIRLAPTGRKWKDDQGNEHEATAIEFLAIYQTEDECRAAADAYFAGDSAESVNATTSNTTEPAANSQPPKIDRATALKFVPILWNNAGRDLARFAEALKRQNLPLSIDDPEVVRLIGAA